ncbi:MAG: hypothetical protein ACRERU_03960, partial [Methylococcales bacterium]
TLSSTVHRPPRRPAMPIPMSLPFLENPPINPEIREHLDNAQRAVVLDKLAQRQSPGPQGSKPNRSSPAMSDQSKISAAHLRRAAFV